jgi:DNA-binding transcriptional ArsR family regulator
MADPTRLRILLVLEAKPRTVGEIVTFFDLSQPTITRHLQALAAAGLVKRNRNGQSVRYELNVEILKSVCLTLVGCFPCCCGTGSSVQTITSIENIAAKRRPSRPTRSKSTTKGGKR